MRTWKWSVESTQRMAATRSGQPLEVVREEWDRGRRWCSKCKTFDDLTNFYSYTTSSKVTHIPCWRRYQNDYYKRVILARDPSYSVRRKRRQQAEKAAWELRRALAIQIERVRRMA